MIYQPCDKEVEEIVEAIMKEHHKDLQEMGVTIHCLYVFEERDKDTGQAIGSALEHDGYPAAATIRPTKLKERAKGHKDAELLIDGPGWPHLTPRQQNALIDHEITHLELVLDRFTLEPKLDDAGRPLLTTRLHDIQCGYFLSVAERWGKDSYEVRDSQQIYDTYKETLFVPNEEQKDDPHPANQRRKRT